MNAINLILIYIGLNFIIVSLVHCRPGTGPPFLVAADLRSALQGLSMSSFYKTNVNDVHIASTVSVLSSYSTLSTFSDAEASSCSSLIRFPASTRFFHLSAS